MIDGTLLDAIREFWTEQKTRDTYERILEAYLGRTEKVTVIVSKGTEGDSASGQVVVTARDYREWMATLQARLDELAGGEVFRRETVDFSGRCVGF